MIGWGKGLTLAIPAISCRFYSPCPLPSMLYRSGPWHHSIGRRWHLNPIPLSRPSAPFSPCTPQLCTNLWITNANPAFSLFSSKSEESSVESIDDGYWDVNPSQSVKRIGWKRVPPFGFPDTPKWIPRKSEGREQKDRSETVGSGHEDISRWQGGGLLSSKHPFVSTTTKNANQKTFDEVRPIVEKSSEEKETNGQKKPPNNQDDSSGNVPGWSHREQNNSSAGSVTNPGSVTYRGSVINRAPSVAKNIEFAFPGKPRRQAHGSAQENLKPVAENHDNVRKLERKLQDGDSQAIGPTLTSVGTNSRGEHGKRSEITRPPFKPKANYYDTPGRSKPERVFQSNKRNCDNPEHYPRKRGGPRSRAAYSPSRPDSNPHEHLGLPKSKLDRSSSAKFPGNFSGGTKFSKGTRSSREEARAVRPHKNADSRVEESSSNKSGTGAYGYKFRDTKTEVGEFRKLVSGSFGDRDGERRTVNTRPPREVPYRPSRNAIAHDNDTEKADSPASPEKVAKYRPRRLEGEKKWQYAVRKKHLGFAGHSRGSTRKSTRQFVDEEQPGEPQGDEDRRRKIIWLCKEIPTLRPRPVVTILNEQRKWINATDTKYIVEHLLEINQPLRAHRVLKWEMQQPWHQFDFDLTTKVAVQLGENNKLSRTRDMYDLIIQNGRVPDLPTYVALINCYVADCENESIGKAWGLYNQMIQMGGYKPPPTLSYNLFQGLAQKGLTYLNQADELLKNMKMAGLVCSAEMYTLLILAHGTKGDHDAVNSLIQEMRETGLPIGQEVYAAILRSCAKDGNVTVGEQAFADLRMAGHKPIPSVYSSLIRMYGKAGLTQKAFETFDDMVQSGILPNLIIYEPMIEIAALSGNRVQAEKLLNEATERRIPSLQACYNAVMEFFSSQGLIEKVETVFQEMEIKGYPPNGASFNIRLEAYVRHGLVNKAETLYEELKVGKFGPNKKTYELMMKLYGESKHFGKVQEVFKELSGRNMDIPEGVKKYVETAVSAKQLEVHRKSKLHLNREQREILAGVLLGGAGIESHDRNRTYELHFALDPETEVGPPLLNNLYGHFSAWSIGAPSNQTLPDPKDLTKSKTLLSFQTVSHGSFRFFAHQYRPKPTYTAVIPRLVHRWLTPRALAYWYMYGGMKCSLTGNILFNTSVYTQKETMLVVNALKSRTIECEKIGSKDGAAICFSGKSANWLWALMEPYILPEVQGFLKPDGVVRDKGEDLLKD